MPVYLINTRGRDHESLFGTGAFFDLDVSGHQQGVFKRLEPHLTPGQLSIVASYSSAETDSVTFKTFKFGRWANRKDRTVRSDTQYRVFFGRQEPEGVITISKAIATTTPLYAPFFDTLGRFKQVSAFYQDQTHQPLVTGQAPEPETWNYEAVLEDFKAVARLAGAEMRPGALTIESLSAPHVPPTTLPLGKMAVYIFSKGPEVLKVGRVGRKSQARYTSQHYNPGSALSTLAASVLADRERLGCGSVDAMAVGSWIRGNMDRVNILMDEQLGVRVLTLLEAFLQCRLKPRYEGFKSQT